MQCLVRQALLHYSSCHGGHPINKERMPSDDKCYSEKKVEQCGTEWLGNNSKLEGLLEEMTFTQILPRQEAVSHVTIFRSTRQASWKALEQTSPGTERRLCSQSIGNRGVAEAARRGVRSSR